MRRWAAVAAAVLLLSGCTPSAPATTGPDAQLDYLLAHWDDRNEAGYGSFGGTDCVNFASQGLVARGWEMDEDWWHLEVLWSHQYSKAWVSSTAFRDYLAGHPELAVDASADEVVVGDIVQFDYDDSGNRDHTATVSRVDDDGTIHVVQHSDDADYRTVEEQLAAHDEGGGRVYYWHVVGD